MAPRTGLLVPVEEDDLAKQLEELLAAGRFTVTGEQPQAYPGFIPQGDPAAPYYTPDPSFRPPLSEGEVPPAPAVSERPVVPQKWTDLGDEIPIPEAVSPSQLDPELVVPKRRQELENLALPDPPTPQTETQDEETNSKNYLSQNILESIIGAPAAAYQFTQPYRQFVGKAAGTVAQLPWMVPAGIEALRALTLKGTPEGTQAEEYARNLEQQGSGARQSMEKLTGAKAVPDTGAEYIAGVLGEAASPAGKMTLPLSGAVAGVRFGLDWLKGDPVTKGGQPPAAMPKELAELLLTTPAEAGFGVSQTTPIEPEKKGKAGGRKGKSPYIEVPAERPLSPSGVPQPVDKEFAVPGETGRRPFTLTQQPNVSILKRPTAPKIKARETEAQFAERVRAWQELNQQWLKQFNPTAVKAIETVGGLRLKKESDLTGMGILGAITIGAVALPPIYQAFKGGLWPRPLTAAEVKVKPVTGALPGTVTNERWSDVFRIINSDVTTMPKVWAERAGMPLAQVERMDDILRSRGWAQKHALVDNAINTGYFRANTLEFKSPVSLDAIGKAVASDPTGNTKRYLVAKDIFEELNKAEQSRKYMAGRTVNEVSETIENTFAREGVSKAPPVPEGKTRLYYEGEFPTSKTFTLSENAPTGQGRVYYIDIPSKSKALTRLTPEGTVEVPLRNADNLSPYAEKTVRAKGVPDEVDVTRYNDRGEPTINGLTKEEALDYMDAYTKMNPKVAEVGKMWEAWNTAVRKFESQGEAATLRRKSERAAGLEDKSYEYLQDQRRGAVPFSGKRDYTMPFDQRVSQTDIIEDMNHRSRARIGDRIKNEDKLYIIDEFGGLKLNPGQAYFQPIKPEVLPSRRVKEPTEVLAESARYQPYTVKVMRRGEPEYYTTSPTMRQVMTFDPYVITQGIPTIMNNMKRGTEWLFTGPGNPVFAFVNPLRVWHGAKQVNQRSKTFGFAGERNPSLLGMAKSVPQQLYPQIAKYFSDAIMQGTGQRAAQWFGPNAPQLLTGLGQQLAKTFDQSLYAQIQRYGGTHGNPIAAQIRQKKDLELREKQLVEADTKMATAGRAVNDLWQGWKKTFGALHEAPAFDYVAKNIGKAPMEDLIARGRNLGGDPKVTGQYLFKDPASGVWRPIQFESNSKTEQMAADVIRRVYGPVADFNRYALPYGNAIVQSVKRVGTAYLNNPIDFTAKVWATTMLPAAVQYLWNQNAGIDQSTGRPYVEHMMNGRPQNKLMTSWYFAIPGRPASDGVELSAVTLEMAFFKAAMEQSMDAMFGTNKVDTTDAIKKALYSALELSIYPPQVPIVAAYEASQGRYPAQSLVGEAKENRRHDPYDQYIGMPQGIEHFMRAMGGGVGNAGAAAMAAYSHTDDGIVNALRNAANEAAQTQLRRVPILANVLDITPKLSGSNPISEEIFNNFKHMDNLVKYYRTVDIGGGEINTKPRSVLGGEIANIQNGPPINSRAPGVQQPPPNDPMYLELMEDMYGFFKRDNPGYDSKGNNMGGVGFLSLVGRYGQASRALKSLGPVDAGMTSRWQRSMDSEEGAMLKGELTEAGVNTDDPRAVKNYYENKRYEAAVTIFYYQKAAEQMMSAKYGKPIKLQDLKPYTGIMDMFSGQAPTGPTGEALQGSITP